MKKETFDKLISGIKTFSDASDAEQRDILYEAIEIALDDLDCDDFFGTEGWKHLFGLAK